MPFFDEGWIREVEEGPDGDFPSDSEPLFLLEPFRPCNTAGKHDFKGGAELVLHEYFNESVIGNNQGYLICPCSTWLRVQIE